VDCLHFSEVKCVKVYYFWGGLPVNRWCETYKVQPGHILPGKHTKKSGTSQCLMANSTNFRLGHGFNSDLWKITRPGNLWELLPWSYPWYNNPWIVTHHNVVFIEIDSLFPTVGLAPRLTNHIISGAERMIVYFPILLMNHVFSWGTSHMD
jgi:hypothetical protein